MPTTRDRYLTSLGRRVAEHRRARGWTQAHLAELAELTGKYLSEVERGVVNPSVMVVRALSSALGTTVGKLLAEPGEVAGDVSELLENRSPQDRIRALRILHAFLDPLPR